MEYIYICPKCKSTYGMPSQTPKVCGDCGISTIYSGYTDENWYALSRAERTNSINEIVNRTSTQRASYASNTTSSQVGVAGTSVISGVKKQYKAVAGPRNINVDKGDTQAAFNMFAEIINREAVGGWEYHSMEAITVTEKPGCFQAAVPINYYMLIFFRELK